MPKKNQKSENPANMAQMFLNFLNTDKVHFSVNASGSTTIDWGDGSSCETFIFSSEHDKSFRHVYSGKSDHIITISGEDITHLDVSGDIEVIETQSQFYFDVSKNPMLKTLLCRNRGMRNIDVSRNTALTLLECSDNQLTSLDVSKNTALTDLSCGVNQLNSLDVSNNTALKTLFCCGNHLTCLDISKNTSLEWLNIGGNYLTNLDISGNNELTELSCDANEFSVSSLNNLFEMLPVVKEGKLNFEGNPGTDACDVCIAENKGWKTPKKMTVTVEGAVEVMIRMAGNKLIYIDWGDKTDVEINKLSGEISEHSHTYTEDTVHRITIFGENITFLACEKQGITSLDVSKNAALKELYCGDNQLTELNVSKNTALTLLACIRNQLTYLDVSQNTALMWLACYDNQFSTDALNDLFGTLPFVKDGAFFIKNNPGASACDITIAENKGWINDND